MSDALEAKDVRKTYRSGESILEVLKGVSLRVEPGALISIVGPSGAGKSTLLHLLAGLDSPTSGSVTWQDRSLSDMGDAELARFRNQAIGIVFQFYHLLPELTTLENVMLPVLVRGGRMDAALRDRAESCLKQVGLAARVTHKPNALSGGELQRAAIARALINEPQLLLCDEPTGNLDSKTGSEVVDLLFGLHSKRRMGLVLVTHQTALAELASRCITLRDGMIVEDTTRKKTLSGGIR